MLECNIVFSSWGGGKLTEERQGITDIETTDYHGEDKFAHELSVGEPHLLLKMLVLRCSFSRSRFHL